jgi:hypothetical protein
LCHGNWIKEIALKNYLRSVEMKSTRPFIAPTPHRGSNVALIIFWLAFVGLWIRVFQQTQLHDVAASLGLLLGLGAIYGVIVAIWVGHNISLARRRNRRRATENITIFPSHDYLGLPVEIRSNLTAEQEIEIRVVNGVKRYSAQDKTGDLALLEVALTGHPQGAGAEDGDLMSKPGAPQ